MAGPFLPRQDPTTGASPAYLVNGNVAVSSGNPLPVTGGGGGGGAPYGATPLGYQQITSLASAGNLTVPGNATFAVVIPDPTGADVRWRDDGVAPTATVGMPLGAGQPWTFSGDLATVKLIQTLAGNATVNVSYYK